MLRNCTTGPAATLHAFMHWAWRLIPAILVLAVRAVASDVTLTIVPQSDGVTYDAVVEMYAPGKPVSGLQLDITCNADRAALQSIEASDAVVSQEKQLWTSEPAPGVLRVLVIGENAFPLLNGAIFRITFAAQNSADSVDVLRLRQVTAASPDGDAVDLGDVETGYRGHRRLHGASARRTNGANAVVVPVAQDSRCRSTNSNNGRNCR